MLDGKIAIVTGAAKGIGRAITHRFAQEGASVLAVDSNAPEVRRVVAEIRRAGGTAAAMVVDVSRHLAARRIVAEAIRRYRRIDILVNNAGLQPERTFFEVTAREWDRILAVNVSAVFWLSQNAGRVMAKTGGGVIINLASVASVVARPTTVPYAASKGAVNMLTRGMAVALAPYKIRVVAIGPGTVLTSTTQYLLHDKVAYDRIMARTPIGRLGQPEEIAAIAAFLASKDASFITGTTVYADGGRLALNGVTMWPVSGRNRR
jgi:NAD(P)-dependent dehydrogenase (short-subunit alcohol dehydrogenase family)